MEKVKMLYGNVFDKLKTLPKESVHCVVTSPPYYGLRDYGVDGQIGLESTPEEYVENMVNIFREVRRVLRDDGTVWLNLGDSYNGSGGPGSQYDGKAAAGYKGEFRKFNNPNRSIDTLKPKDLIGIPWRVAFALQADGWWLRQDIIWHKPNPMPESVKDRCTKAHEYIFLLSKSKQYHYDHEAIKESSVDPEGSEARYDYSFGGKKSEHLLETNQVHTRPIGVREFDGKRNRRSVWTVATKPFKEAHFAVFPPDLIKPCILAGTSSKGCCSKCGAPWVRKVERTPMKKKLSGRKEQLGVKGKTCCSGKMVSPPKSKTVGWEPSCNCKTEDVVPCIVLDPFIGSGTTGEVALKTNRRCIGIELNKEYKKIIDKRLEPYLNVQDLFVGSNGERS
jgi:DNA modification methylase